MNQKLAAAKQAAVRSFIRRGRPATRALSISLEHNVVGVGIGKKITQGQYTDTDCIRFYVERKLNREVVPERLQLPPAIDGIPTDVVESGRFRIGPANAAAARVHKPVEQSKLRPAPPGCSVGFGMIGGMIMAGTFGAVVSDGANSYILSNNHVLADVDHLPAGSPIYQPGLLDGGNTASDQIAMLTRAVRLDPNAPNQVDCAIAQVIVPGDVTPVPLPQVGRLASAQPIDASTGMSVEKVGRTTSYTRSTVFDIDGHMQVDYDGTTFDFDNIIVISNPGNAFSDAGDSGSLIVDAATKRATALLFAGSSQFTLASKLDLVLAALGVTLTV